MLSSTLERAPRAVRALLLSLATAAGCVTRPATPAETAAAAAAAPDTSLVGAFRWTTFNDRAAPVEFPAGSGATLLSGTLELRGGETIALAGQGRFGLRFTMRRTPADSARTSGEDGRYRLAGDSLVFTPDGKEDRPPVRFRYAWRAGGVLALTDAQGNVWGYVRQ